MWLDWLVFCDYGFSVSALWCPLTTLTVLLGFLLPRTWGYLFMAAPAKHSHWSLRWTRGISSPPPLLTLNVEQLLSALLRPHSHRSLDVGLLLWATWTSPDGQHWNQIDYILCSQRWRSAIQSAKTRPGADCGSNLELLIAKFRLKLKKVGETTRRFRYDLNQIPYDCTVEVRNRFKGLDLIKCLKNYGWRFMTLHRRNWSRSSPRKRNGERENGSLRKPYK